MSYGDTQREDPDLIDTIAAAIYEGTTRNHVAEWEDIVLADPDEPTDGPTAEQYRTLAEIVIDLVRQGTSS